MAYISRIPAPPLDAYVDDVYYLDSPLSPRLEVFPMPSLHLMFNLGGAFRVRHGDQLERVDWAVESWCTGLWSSYHVVDYPENVACYGVHFKPYGAAPFFSLPLSDLQNRVVPLDTLWRHIAAEIGDRLHAAPSPEVGLALLEHALLARLSEAPRGLEIVEHAVARIATHRGTLSIRALSDQLGVSQNHLGTLFKRTVGVAPKELSRVYRFAEVLRSIDPTAPVDWTRTAHQTGFYDQAHFNKEFVAFTGNTPSAYLERRRRFHADRPLATDIGYLPVE